MQLTLRATDRWKQKMKIGYARVSTIEQNLDLQIRALKAAGAEKIFTDQGVSGASVIKPAYFEALAFARPGDEIMVWKLDRLSRSLRDLITPPCGDFITPPYYRTGVKASLGR